MGWSHRYLQLKDLDAALQGAELIPEIPDEPNEKPSAGREPQENHSAVMLESVANRPKVWKHGLEKRLLEKLDTQRPTGPMLRADGPFH